MKIKVQMMGTLKEKTPEDGEFNCLDDMTLDELLHTLEVGEAPTVLVNEKPQFDRNITFNEGDEVTVIGLVGGG